MRASVKNNLSYGSLALLAAFLWGLASVFIKVALESASPLAIMTLRFTIAAFCFLLIFHRRIWKNWADIQWGPCLLIGLFLGVMNLTVHYSLSLTSATTATFFFSIPAIFTPFVGYLLFRYPFRGSHFVIVAMVVVGLYLLCNTESGFHFGWGEFLGAVSSLTFAIAMVLQNQYLPKMDNITVAAVQTIVIALLSWIVVLPAEGIGTFSGITGRSWGMLLYLGIFGAFLTSILQNVSIDHIDADYVSVILAMEPVFTAGIAFFVLKEVLTLPALCGAALIIAGVVIITLSGRSSPGTLTESRQKPAEGGSEDADR